MFGWFRKRRRAKLLSQSWPDGWSLHLNRNVRLSWHLSDREMTALQQRVKVFVDEKHWEGCDGLTLNEEMKVTVAAQASLMLLGVDDYYFDNVSTILLYPRSFRRTGTSRFVQPTPGHRNGEAWQGGPIVLSWEDSLRGGRNEDDGQNVVIHEFAHALDGLDGEMGGNVVFDQPEHAERWELVVQHEFETLVADRDHHRSTLLDYYGATNLAEFFAVASETFFEQPHQMQTEHPELFQLLELYYHVDPRAWQPRGRRRR